MNATTINVGELLKELRCVIDQREALAEQDKRLSEKKSEIETSLLDYQKTSGLRQLADDSITVSFDPSALRAKYDPDKWPELVQWAVSTDNLHIIQRRLTDAKVVGLIDEGVALPEGLSVEQYTKISTKRK